MARARGWPCRDYVFGGEFHVRSRADLRLQVLVDDNFHYMDESERYELGVFATADEAIAACKLLVDKDLEAANKPGMTADALYENYVAFGPDPFVVSPGSSARVEFSAWKYAKERSQTVASP